MLIETIEFQIHDFSNNTTEEFLVENTIENQEMVFSHKFTRQIKFTKTFAFQFEKEMRIPAEMISMDTWMRLFDYAPLSFIAAVEEQNEAVAESV
jgi:hypothetical protein